MSSYIDQQEIPSFQRDTTTNATETFLQLEKEYSEDEFQSQPIPLYEPGIEPHIEAPLTSPTGVFDTVKVRNGGVEVFTGPWLPPRVKKLLQKAQKRRLSESEIIGLMESIAERSIEHFDLSSGTFAAITFSGRIAELSDTKLDLLRKIQAKKYPEQIFVWKVGSKSFSGRI